MPSIRIRPVLAIGASLFALAGASLLDVARMQPEQMAAARGDRQNVASASAGCAKDSVMAACASGTQASMQSMPKITLLQAFDGPSKTILVKVNAN
jgi:hypothetical protein